MEITVATHAEVSHQIARIDAGFFFTKPVFSKQASAPTKLAEFLCCGISCLGNAGSGDMAEVLEGELVDLSLEAFNEAALASGLQALLDLYQTQAAEPAAWQLRQSIFRWIEVIIKSIPRVKKC